MQRRATLTRRAVLISASAVALAPLPCWGRNISGRPRPISGQFDGNWASWGIFSAFVIPQTFGTTRFVGPVVLRIIELFVKPELGNGERDPTTDNTGAERDDASGIAVVAVGPDAVEVIVPGHRPVKLVRADEHQVRAEIGHTRVAEASVSECGTVVVCDQAGRFVREFNRAAAARVLDAILARHGIAGAVDACLAEDQPRFQRPGTSSS